jgi:hypothetical protein
VAARIERVCQELGCKRAVYARDWCGMHYKRWLRTGSPVRGERPTTCAVDGCERDAKSRGWCHAHYQQWRRHDDASKLRPLRSAGPCDVEGCDRQRYARGYCSTHYKRLVLTGDVRPDDPIRIVTGEGFEHHGYWLVPVPAEDRWLVDGERKAAEHRLVMARHLGRPLLPDESVHHRNGERTDNRLENLELWSDSHPSGQRVEDKIAWALSLLRRYTPHLLAAEPPEEPPVTTRETRVDYHAGLSSRTPDQI